METVTRRTGGRFKLSAATVATTAPVKMAPSLDKLNKPVRKIKIMAKPENIKGIMSSTIFPILRREAKGPRRKLEMACMG
jgi:hypothetical protein